MKSSALNWFLCIPMVYSNLKPDLEVLSQYIFCKTSVLIKKLIVYIWDTLFGKNIINIILLLIFCLCL